MVVLALNIRKLSVPDCIAACRSVLGKMTNNINFPNPNPTLAAVKAAIDQLETTYQKGLKGSHAMKTQQKLDLKALLKIMDRLKSYVQNESGDDMAKALSSGIALKKKGGLISFIDRVMNLKATPQRTQGEVKLKWNRVPHRKIYLIYAVIAEGDYLNKANWTMLGCSSFPRYHAKGLQTANRYAFFVQAVGAYAVGAASDPAFARVF